MKTAVVREDTVEYPDKLIYFPTLLITFECENSYIKELSDVNLNGNIWQ